jgi:hypothetical protein
MGAAACQDNIGLFIPGHTHPPAGNPDNHPGTPLRNCRCETPDNRTAHCFVVDLAEQRDGR